jgi:hypothetical protein
MKDEREIGDSQDAWEEVGVFYGVYWLLVAFSSIAVRDLSKSAISGLKR